MISWTWRIGSAYSSLPSVKTTSWRVVASVGIGFLRENWKCAPVIGPDGRLLSAPESLVGKNRGPLHRALAADVRPLRRAVRRAPATGAGGHRRAAGAPRATGREAAARPARRGRRAAGRARGP